MRRRIDESEMGNRQRRVWLAVAGLLAAAMIAILVWRSVQAQVPHSGVELVWVIDDEDRIKREKHGEVPTLGCLLRCESYQVFQLTVLDEAEVR